MPVEVVEVLELEEELEELLLELEELELEGIGTASSSPSTSPLEVVPLVLVVPEVDPLVEVEPLEVLPDVEVEPLEVLPEELALPLVLELPAAAPYCICPVG